MGDSRDIKGATGLPEIPLRSVDPKPPFRFFSKEGLGALFSFRLSFSSPEGAGQTNEIAKTAAGEIRKKLEDQTSSLLSQTFYRAAARYKPEVFVIKDTEHSKATYLSQVLKAAYVCSPSAESTQSRAVNETTQLLTKFSEGEKAAGKAFLTGFLTNPMESPTTIPPKMVRGFRALLASFSNRIFGKLPSLNRLVDQEKLFSVEQIKEFCGTSELDKGLKGFWQKALNGKSGKISLGELKEIYKKNLKEGSFSPTLTALIPEIMGTPANVEDSLNDETTRETLIFKERKFLVPYLPIERKSGSDSVLNNVCAQFEIDIGRVSIVYEDTTNPENGFNNQSLRTKELEEPRLTEQAEAFITKLQGVVGEKNLKPLSIYLNQKVFLSILTMSSRIITHDDYPIYLMRHGKKLKGWTAKPKNKNTQFILSKEGEKIRIKAKYSVEEPLVFNTLEDGAISLKDSFVNFEGEFIFDPSNPDSPVTVDKVDYSYHLEEDPNNTEFH